MKDDKTIKEWMELAVMYSAIIDNHHFYKDQITNYDWVEEDFVTECSNRIINIIPSSGIFEYSINTKPNFVDLDCDSGPYVKGTFDYITDDENWEFKCTASLTDDHKNQCAGYISLYFKQTGKLLPCKLYNVRTRELLVVSVNDPLKYFDVLLEKYQPTYNN